MSITTTTNTTIQSQLENTDSRAYNYITIIERYTLKDIAKLEDLAERSEADDKNLDSDDSQRGTGRCSTALASLCFATIEQVGLILREDLNDDNQLKLAITRGNIDNAKSFFNFFGGNGLSPVRPEEIEAVYYLFRNKITHNLFPKYELGISLDSSNQGVQQLVISTDGIQSLNVNFLSTYIKEAIPIIKDIFENFQQNIDLISRVNSNLTNIESIESKLLRDKYKSQYTSPDLRQIFEQWIINFDWPPTDV